MATEYIAATLSSPAHRTFSFKPSTMPLNPHLSVLKYSPVLFMEKTEATNHYKNP
jgi:hypothetical protein